MLCHVQSRMYQRESRNLGKKKTRNALRHNLARGSSRSKV